MVLWLWTVGVAAEYMKYKDPTQPLKVRVKDLMRRMTLEEKIGQMTQIERGVASAEVIEKFFIGMPTKINFDCSFLILFFFYFVDSR